MSRCRHSDYLDAPPFSDQSNMFLKLADTPESHIHVKTLVRPCGLLTRDGIWREAANWISCSTKACVRAATSWPLHLSKVYWLKRKSIASSIALDMSFRSNWPTLMSTVLEQCVSIMMSGSSYLCWARNERTNAKSLNVLPLRGVPGWLIFKGQWPNPYLSSNFSLFTLSGQIPSVFERILVVIVDGCAENQAKLILQHNDTHHTRHTRRKAISRTKTGNRWRPPKLNQNNQE